MVYKNKKIIQIKINSCQVEYRYHMVKVYNLIMRGSHDACQNSRSKFEYLLKDSCIKWTHRKCFHLFLYSYQSL
jgi:hypothetical protein